MSETKIINYRNYNPDDHKAFISERPSKTVPGQDMPIRELVDRYVRGQNVETFTPTYTDEIDPTYFKMDKQDSAMAARHIKRQIERERRKAEQQQQAVGRQIDLEEAIEEVKKEKESKEKAASDNKDDAVK